MICKELPDPGEELVEDYLEYGIPQKWLADFAKTHNIPLIFSGFNDFC